MGDGHSNEKSKVVSIYFGCCFLLFSVLQDAVAFRPSFISTAPLQTQNIPIPSCCVPTRQKFTTTSRRATLSPQDSSLRGFDNNDNDEEEDGLGDIQIPSTGVSVNDEMESQDMDRFETELVPIEGYKKIAAQIVTTTESRASFEPVRYLLSLSPPPPSVESTVPSQDDGAEEDDNNSSNAPSQPTQTTKFETTTGTLEKIRTFVLMDIPPFSPRLVAKMKVFMGENSRLAAILVTSRDAIHYDDAPAVYRMRRADLDYWKKAFPGLEIVAYRLDIPRDCRESITQVLDGYGPFALEETISPETGNIVNATFVETGRPLVYKEWDHDVAQDILRGRLPLNASDDEEEMDNQESYTPEAIRAKEQGKRVLAVYTPGHSFGSMSYIFPETGICCSGYTIPVEDTRYEDNPGMDSTGPALDCRGYITTSRGGIVKQMASARELVNTYCDRFNVVLPSRGDPLMLMDDDSEEKKEILMDILDQYEKIGKIYEELGITSSDA